MTVMSHPSISEAIVAATPGAAAGAIMACGWDSPEAANIDVLPARADLLNREHEVGPAGALRRLSRALNGVTDDYDFTLIDTRPDLGHLVQMALVATDTVVIVTNPGYDSIEAATRIRDYIASSASDLYNDNLKVSGVIVNQYRPTAEAHFQIEGLTNLFGNLVWRFDSVPRGLYQPLPAFIPMWTRFEEADAASAPLSAWTDRKGKDTTEIFDEIARRVAQLSTPIIAPIIELTNTRMAA